MLTGKTEEKKNILDFEDTIVYEGLTQESLDCLTELMSIFEQEDFQKGFEKDIEFWEREKEKREKIREWQFKRRHRWSSYKE